MELVGARQETRVNSDLGPQREVLNLELEGLDVLVLGLGMSGRSAARYCAARGARVVAADEAPADQIGDLDDLGRGVEVLTGATLPDAADFDLVVPSPGVPRERYADRARRVWGDIELASRALDIPVIAITGTNGKSTTVYLVEAMLRAAGLRATAAGNVGHPALSLVGEALDVAVLEVSSFQLEAVESFRPRVSAILNLSSDHLDRHGDFETYVTCKKTIFANQRDADSVVLNFDDARLRAIAAEVEARVIPFSSREPLTTGVMLDSGAIVLRDEHEILRVPLEAFPLAGTHNLENMLAATACVWALGADPRTAIRAVANFHGLPHRFEMLPEAGDVSWINDSKATNPGAAIRSLDGFTKPVIWIAGGRDKDVDFDELLRVAKGRVKLAILIGEAAAMLDEALAKTVETRLADSMETAVRLAADNAEPGDVVLLSPACASFDQFQSFEERGNRFRAAVAALGAGEEDGGTGS